MMQFYNEVKKEHNNYPEAIKELRETLEEEQPELEQYFIELWDNQQREITAQQYIEMVKKGKVTNEIEKQLLQSTTIFVLGKMFTKKQTAMEKGAEKIVKKITERQSSFSFDIKYHETKKWIEKSCAEQIVQLTKTQKEAIKLVIDRAETLGITTEGTADLLKPMIGLHKGQVTANVNYYNSIKQNLLENHTKMKEQTAEQKALEKAKQYAKKQKEYRAMTIARTELAGAYNAGEYYSIKQAQKDGLMGKVKKYVITAGDGRVCKGCREVEGQEANQNEYFKTQWGDVLFPPFHTSCRCAVEYEEVTETLEAPEINDPKIKASHDEFTQILQESEDNEFNKNMKFLHQTTEYQLDKKLGSAFAYDKDLDLIKYNPNAPNYDLYDMNIVQAHELSHRMDELLYRSWENEKFIKSVENTSKIIYNYEKEIKEWFKEDGKYFDDIGFSDIFSALSKGKMNGILNGKHKERYWKNTENVYREIFANLSAIDVLNCESKMECTSILKEVYEAYKELIA
ncbi:phage minor head protein [Clostridium sp. MD294]|uniref:phage minor head protein n=1 Tax=Clostridium sp. MD294 TaxID=97138 RepID=UPI0002C9496E|nr:phage minor head protein [Clostridium sp. MD294]NDO45983.1 hypothetical protein [Clostridium sp. MD294]USF30357.1 hypothetical protein C820_001798 [Clostridium sp. MD294]